MPQETHELLLPEPEARRLLLAQALDETDTQHRLVGAAEREEIDRAALAATGDPALGQPLRPRLFLLERAGRLLDLLAHRQPAVAALQEPPAWRVLLAWGLPLLALLVGALIDRIDNPRQVNLLSPPLLAFLLWNIGVYLVLLVLALRPASARGPLGRLLGAGLGWPRRGPPVAQAFARRWSDAAAAVEARRRARILHVAAAAWGVGVALSIVLGGVVREYRVGWESTLLDAPQVHAFLRALFAPVVALLPVEGFSLQEVSRLHFGSGADVGRAEARRWVGLYVALLALVVVVPRVLLAAWAAAGERRLASRVRIDLAQPYYEALLGRVQPARLRLAWLPSDPGSAAVLEAILRQAAEAPPPSTAVPWTITATSRGDELLVTPQAQLAVPTLLPVEATPRSWWERWRAPAARPPAPSDAAGDVLLLVADEPADLERLLPALRAAGRPVLLLAAGGSEAAHEVLLRGVGAPAQVLSLHALPNWTADPRLLDALSRVLPSYRQGGLERLRTAWMDRAQARFAAAMRLLAQELFDAAADTEPLGSLGLRQLVLANEREAGREAREQARTVLLQRLHERRQATDARLLETHGALAHGSLPEPAVALDWQPQQKVDARQAGLAGAASGAAMGATLDLMTGVMTLGAASALGGLIGGGAAFAAAAWRNTTGQGAAQGLAMSDEMLQTLAELALLRYLAVAHAQRLVPQDTRERWPSAVRQAIQQHRPALEQAWVRARERADGEQAVAALAVTLRDAVRPLLS